MGEKVELKDNFILTKGLINFFLVEHQPLHLFYTPAHLVPCTSKLG